MPSSFDPSSDIPNLAGKIIFITGGNAGIGAATVTALAAHEPEHIYLTTRRAGSAQPLLDEIKAAAPNAKLTVLDLDTSKLASVKACAARFLELSPRLDLLILNAGIAGVAQATSVDGYELTMATNHIGHALLTQLLMPQLLRTAAEPGADVRVVVVSSKGHVQAPGRGVAIDKLKTNMVAFSPFSLYAQSKLANILFASGLAQRYPQIKAVSLHPGVVKSSIWGKADGFPWIVNQLAKPYVWLLGVTVEEGAKTQLWACVSPEVKSGTYYMPIGLTGYDSAKAKSVELREELWDWTTKELASHGGPGWAAAKL